MPHHVFDKKEETEELTDDLPDLLKMMMADQKGVKAELICYNCGLYYYAISSKLFIDKRLINLEGMDKISEVPDNGKIIFPYEVRCPTCNSYEYLLDNRTKAFVILPMIATGDSRVRTVNLYSRSLGKADTSDVLKWLIREYKKDKNNVEIILRLANTYRKLNDYDRAKKLYLKALKLDKTEPDIYFNLGEIYLCRDDLKRAKHCFKMVHKYDKKVMKKIKKDKEAFDETREFISKINF